MRKSRVVLFDIVFGIVVIVFSIMMVVVWHWSLAHGARKISRHNPRRARAIFTGQGLSGLVCAQACFGGNLAFGFRFCLSNQFRRLSISIARQSLDETLSTLSEALFVII